MAVSTFAVPIEMKHTDTVTDIDSGFSTTTKMCDACESVFTKAENVLKDPRLIANTVKMAEELICDRLPEDGQAKCNTTMEDRIPAFFDGIANHWLDPTTDCAELGFCHNSTISREDIKSNDLKCDICTKVVEFIGNNVLESDKVLDYVTEELDVACGLLPAKYTGICETAANASVPEILSYAATFIESNGCSFIGFCDKKYVEAPAMWSEFREFMRKFNKVYSSALELATRLEIFRENVKYIAEHSTETLRLKMNEFGDMTPVEFGVHKKDGCFLDTGLDKVSRVSCKPFVANMSLSVPTEVDWRTKGAVTPVKNQGSCGSCWSFSATGTMEGANFIKTGKLVSFSEQELVDCSTSFGNMGCNGGLMDYAFEFAVENGMCSEDEEPYKARDMKCDKCAEVAEFTGGCFDVPSNDEDALMRAVAQQPVSVAIEADNNVFMFYDGGIIDDAGCGEKLDHGVLAVGYGEENGKKYWIVKNSWSTSWGENGYVRIARDETKKGAGICGIASQPSLIVA
jgi:KDEL-tailed cysteine endopeptidase